GMAFSPDGRLFASGSVNPTLRIWDMTAAQPRQVAELMEKDGGSGLDDIAFSPDGRWIAAGRHWGSRSLRLWKVETQGVQEMNLLKMEAARVGFSPDGKTLA